MDNIIQANLKEHSKQITEDGGSSIIIHTRGDKVYFSVGKLTPKEAAKIISDVNTMFMTQDIIEGEAAPPVFH